MMFVHELNEHRIVQMEFEIDMNDANVNVPCTHVVLSHIFEEISNHFRKRTAKAKAKAARQSIST